MFVLNRADAHAGTGVKCRIRTEMNTILRVDHQW